MNYDYPPPGSQQPFAPDGTMQVQTHRKKPVWPYIAIGAGILILLLVAGFVSCVALLANAPATKASPTHTAAAPLYVPPTTQPTTPSTSPSPAAPKLSKEQENAIKSAQSYLSFGAFSRKGLIKQLSSSAGEGYPVNVATFAVDYLKIDFNEQAYKAAKSYLDLMSFSRSGLIKQLESDAGEGFTHAQALYAVDKVGL